MCTWWPLSASGVARAVAIIPAPRTAIVVTGSAFLATQRDLARLAWGQLDGLVVDQDLDRLGPTRT